MSVTVGIDYSMTSPSICVHDGTEWSFNNCKFYFLTQKKKNTIGSKQFLGNLHDEYSSQQERFSNIATWAVSKIPKNAKVGIEGYAYASTGVVFDIGENTGLLKHMLWSSGHKFSVYSPPTIKKFASGKGNANKVAMYESFLSEVGIEIHKSLGCKIGDSPASDIVDSYYIAKYRFHES